MGDQHDARGIPVQPVHQKTGFVQFGFSQTQQAAVVAPLRTLGQQPVRLEPDSVTAFVLQQFGFFRLARQNLVIIEQLDTSARFQLPLGLPQPHLLAFLGPPAGALGHGILDALLGQARGFRQRIYRKPGAFNSQVDGLAHGGWSTPVSGKQARHYSGNGYGSAPLPAVLLFVKADIQGDRIMPLIGWLFLFAAFALVVGSLLFLRDSANMKIPKEKLEKIRERKAEQEKKDEEW